MTSSTWQPIDSAPNDVEILVYTKRWGTIIARHSGEHDEWLSRMQVPVSLGDDEDSPTHWHPLPDPPEGAARDGVEPAETATASAPRPDDKLPAS